MKHYFFKFLAKLNKIVLPSYSKKQLELAKATKFQMAIIGWRYFVTTNALGAPRKTHFFQKTKIMNKM
jgi:hypothetical protein